MVDRLTTKDYWERSYAGRAGSHLGMSGIASRPNREMLAALESVGVAGKTVLEVGAGDSLWIPFLATRYADSQFIGLDYTERGCALLRSKCSHLPNVRVVKCDMFLPTEELLGCADLVTSFGVVEHFADLGATLLAISKFARPSGVVFTSIPNLSGLLGSGAGAGRS
jgi:cyclopropane fatty-acyl-phospholipid synthase-like methyltransferase